MPRPKEYDSREAFEIDTSFYYDEEDGTWYVFGDSTGFAYASFSDKQEAKEYTDYKNKLKKEYTDYKNKLKK